MQSTWLLLALSLLSCDDAVCDDPSCLQVPTGWQGPVAMVLGEAPTCARDVVFLGVIGLQPAPAVCECACEPERQLTTCTASAELTVYPSETEPCDEQQPERRIGLEAGCTTLPTGLFRKSYSVEVMPASASGIACTPVPTVERPALVWESEAAVCALDAAPREARTCIWVDGDLPCPGGDFSERSLVLEGLEDGRGCTECACGDAEVACDAMVDVFTGGTCAGFQTTLVDECTGLATVSAGASLTLGKPAVSCEPSTPTPTGAVGFVQDHTVCCLPE